MTQPGSRAAIECRTRASGRASRNVFRRGADTRPLLVDRWSARDTSGAAAGYAAALRGPRDTRAAPRDEHATPGEREQDARAGERTDRGGVPLEPAVDAGDPHDDGLGRVGRVTRVGRAQVLHEGHALGARGRVAGIG